MRCWNCNQNEASKRNTLCPECNLLVASDGETNEKYHKKAKKKRKKLNKYVDELKSKPTASQERALKKVRRMVNKLGIQVQEEKIVGTYIIDIYIPLMKIGIEIDGGIHDERSGYDNQRDETLKGFGVKVYRFTNEQVPTDYFCEAIWSIIYHYMATRYLEKIRNRAKEYRVILPERIEDL